MRVVLINTPASMARVSFILPAGIMSLAAHLENNGHQVKIVDVAKCHIPNKEVLNQTFDFEPDLIGIGGLVTAYKYIIDLTTDLKNKKPNIPIVIGGQVTLSNIENCFNYMPIDFVISGYGEIALQKLTLHLEGKLEAEKIPALAFKDGNDIVMNEGREFFRRVDDMPFPAYHLVDMEHYVQAEEIRNSLTAYLAERGVKVNNMRFASMNGTLGCTDRCTFCVHEQEFVGLKVFSNDYLKRHIQFLVDNYGVNVFGFGEEMFLTTFKRAKQMNTFMKENFPDVYWYASTRANWITKETVEELSAGNCFRVVFGMESGSQKMLDLMQKNITRQQNIDAYKNLNESPITAACSLMVGNIGETYDTIKETVAAVHEAKIVRASAFIASAFPGGRTWDWAFEKGLIGDSHKYLLEASKTNHVQHINSNLTPYPDFILRSWQAIVQWAGVKEEFKKKNFGVYANYPKWKRPLVYLKRYIVPYNYFPYPIPLLKFINEVYFFFHKLRKKVYTTEKDRKYEIVTDKKGVILPMNLYVGKNQRELSDEDLQKLWEKPQNRVPLLRKSEELKEKVST